MSASSMTVWARALGVRGWRCLGGAESWADVVPLVDRVDADEQVRIVGPVMRMGKPLATIGRPVKGRRKVRGTAQARAALGAYR